MLELFRHVRLDLARDQNITHNPPKYIVPGQQDLGLDLPRLERYAEKEVTFKGSHEILYRCFSSNILILNYLETGCYTTTDVRQKMIHDLFLVK